MIKASKCSFSPAPNIPLLSFSQQRSYFLFQPQRVYDFIIANGQLKVRILHRPQWTQRDPPPWSIIKLTYENIVFYRNRTPHQSTVKISCSPHKMLTSQTPTIKKSSDKREQISIEEFKSLWQSLLTHFCFQKPFIIIYSDLRSIAWQFYKSNRPFQLEIKLKVLKVKAF